MQFPSSAGMTISLSSPRQHSCLKRDAAREMLDFGQGEPRLIALET